MSRRDGHGMESEPLAAMAREDRRIGSILRLALMLVGVLIVGLGGWSAVTQISGAVVAPGQVVVESNAKTIQHLEGGIITEIAVRDGQRVAAGDLLLRLDAGTVGERLKGLEAEAAAKQSQLASVEAELKDLRALEKKRLVPRKRILESERSRSGLVGDLGRINSEMARAKAEDDRLTVRAPIAGRVHKLQFHTVGGVIGPGQEVLTIVPSDAVLLLEARVDPASIDQVHEGQLARVRLSSFNQRTTPELDGEVVNVSADLVADKRGEVFHYLARIALPQAELSKLEGPLIPGMPADVFIRSESRTVLSYLMKPLADQWQRALLEE